MRPHTHTHTHTHIHVLTVLTHTHIHTNRHAYTHNNEIIHARRHTRSHKYTLTDTRVRAGEHTHTHTHTHTIVCLFARLALSVSSFARQDDPQHGTEHETSPRRKAKNHNNKTQTAFLSFQLFTETDEVAFGNSIQP